MPYFGCDFEVKPLKEQNQVTNASLLDVVIPDVSQLGLPGVKPQSVKESARGSELSSGVTGLKSLGVRDLTYKLAFGACHVASMVNKAGGNEQLEVDLNDQKFSSLSDAEVLQLKGNGQDEHIYDKLVNSIAPAVFGHEVIKREFFAIIRRCSQTNSRWNQLERGYKHLYCW